MQDTVQRIISFLTEIGIPTRFRSLEQPTFLPGILIENGELVIDMDKMLYPGDLLHEAGHIAVEPPERRPHLQDNVEADKPMGERLEMAVILWSYAALRHLDLPADLVFHAEGYKGDASWLAEEFAEGRYLALPLLQWLGMACDEKKAAELGVAPFPAMQHWLRPS